MRDKIQNTTFERRNFQKVVKNSYGGFIVKIVLSFYIFFKYSSITYLNNSFKVELGEKIGNKVNYFCFCISSKIIINFNVPLMKISISTSLRFIVSENSTKIS